MPDLESAQNFGTLVCATTQSKHVFLLDGHIWSQGGHTSNLHDARIRISAKFCRVMCHIPPLRLETFVTGNWDQLGLIGTNLGPIWEQIQKSALYKA